MWSVAILLPFQLCCKNGHQGTNTGTSLVPDKYNDNVIAHAELKGNMEELLRERDVMQESLTSQVKSLEELLQNVKSLSFTTIITEVSQNFKLKSFISISYVAIAFIRYEGCSIDGTLASDFAARNSISGMIARLQGIEGNIELLPRTAFLLQLLLELLDKY